MNTQEITLVSPKNNNALQQIDKKPSEFRNQKLVLSLKSDLSQDYLFWKASVSEYDRISKSGSLKENFGKVKLTVLTRKLKDLMSNNFTQIETEVEDLISYAHQIDVDFEQDEFVDKYWDIQNQIQHFRKEARQIQIEMLQHVNKHLPLFIY